MANIYYNIDLYNCINNYTIYYNRKIANCITLIKIIEENYENSSCKMKIIKYINKLFQNKYKIRDTKSIEIIYGNKELYYYENDKLDNKCHNNIKLKIKEKLEQIDEFNNNKEINNSWKIKNNNNKNGKCKNNNGKFSQFKLSKEFKRYIENIKFLKENLCTNITGCNCLANKIEDEIPSKTIYKNFSNIDETLSIANEMIYENLSDIALSIKINI